MKRSSAPLRRMRLKPKGRRAVQADAELAHYRAEVSKRCRGRCENPRCTNLADDPHHPEKPRRAQHPMIVALCRACHEQVDAPLTSGRLVIRYLGHPLTGRGPDGTDVDERVHEFFIGVLTSTGYEWQDAMHLPVLAPYSHG